MYGGVETLLATLAREAGSAPGMASEFALCFDGQLAYELAMLGHAPHIVGGVRLSRPHTIVRARRALRELLGRGAFDAVVCHQPWAAVIFAGEARRAGLPVVLWLHMATDRGHWLNRLCRVTRPDLVLCNSQYTASTVLDWFPGAPVEYVHAPVSVPAVEWNAARRRAMRRALSTDETDVVVAHVGRLEEFKGQRVLLHALAELRETEGWTCWLVGGAQRPVEESFLAALRALARELGIADRLRFLGRRDDVGALLRSADVYCQPNTAPEGFGLTFIEAMRAGLPVVTSGIGGACEIVDGHCGVLIAPGDVAALARSLGRLVADAAFRLELADEAGRRSSLLCHPARQMARVHSVLASARPEALGGELAGARLR